MIAAPLNTDVFPALQEIEVSSRFQIPSFQIVGLADREVGEARERIRAAIESSGREFPRKRILVNLSPANVRKSGTGLDLPMAIAILCDGESLPFICAWGELGLDGRLKSSGQTLRALYAAWKHGANWLVLPTCDRADLAEAWALLEESSPSDGQVQPPRLCLLSNLSDWVGKESLEKFEHMVSRAATAPRSSTSASLPLGPQLARSIVIAASGEHSVYLVGARGAGKSTAIDMLARIRPRANAQERLTRALLQDLAGVKRQEGPIRVSQNVRPAALIGRVRGSEIRPGQFSLAHGGILVADELPEWSRDSLEILREPLERGQISLTRAEGSAELPSRFLLAATGNLCPCGGARCRCPPSIRERYARRISGPLLDRIDLAVFVRAELGAPETPVTFLEEQVARTRESLLRSWGSTPGSWRAEAVEAILQERPTLQNSPLLQQAVSLRSRHKLLRVAATLAALDSRPTQILEADLLEAQSYRIEIPDVYIS